MTEPRTIAGTNIIDPATLPARAAASANATPPAQAPANSPAPKPAQTPISLIIRPSARDRWQSSLISQYTPSYVENICRGAMAGNLMSQYLMFDLMEQTWPRLNKNLNELKNAVIDLEWNLQPFALKGQKPTAEAQRRAQILEHLIWDMEPDIKANENDFNDTIYDVLDALGKSISVLELDIPPQPVQIDLGAGVENVYPIRATRFVHPRYYGYPNYPVTSDELMLNAKEVKFSNPNAQLPDNDGSIWIKFPEDKFIVSIIKQKSGHPLNSGFLRLLGVWWSMTNFTWEWALNFAQIFGMPLRWANFDPSSSQETINLIEELLRNMGSAAYAAFPAGTDLKILEAAKGGQDNPQKMLIDAADTICDILILGQTLTTTQGARGSQSLGNIHKDVRDEKISAVAKVAAKILNQQFLKPLCRLNFGDDRFCPYFEPAEVQAKDSVAVATKFKTILSIPGVEVSKQQFYEENDLIVPAAGDDVLVGQSSGPQQQPNDAGDDSAGSGDDFEEGPVGGSSRAAASRRHRGCDHTAARARSAATESVVDQAMADLTGVSARWLGGVRPFFDVLLAKAKDGSISDNDFVLALRKAQGEIPELFSRLHPGELQTALEKAMGAAAGNGAVRAHLQRRGK
jgi:phage gp29-like protein